MAHRYNSAVAQHYAAFRPPLHELILERLVPPSRRYQNGLDVGCGTGRSAVALAQHCHRVTAIDPSPAMLAQAAAHPSIEFLAADAPGLAATNAGPFDCITFAGSLFYAKSPELRTALPRLLAADGNLLIYDFEVLLNEVTTSLGLNQQRPISPYDHALGIVDWPEFSLEINGEEHVQLDLTTEQLAHVVLADSDLYDQLQNRAGNPPDLFRWTVQSIAQLSDRPVLRARLLYARYLLASPPTRSPVNLPT